MFRPSQKLGRSCLLHPLKRHSTQGHGFAFVGGTVGKQAFVGDLREVPHIPEEQSPIRTHGCALCARLARQPHGIIDRVIMGNLYNGLACRRGPFPEVIKVHHSSVAATDQKISVFVVVLAADQRRLRSQLCKRSVAFGDVPDEGCHGHLFSHALELQVRVGACNFRGSLGVPTDLGDAALLLRRIFEKCDCLHVEVLRKKIGFLLLEVVFKKINAVVLLEASNCLFCKLPHCCREGRIFV
mmetsp:Transcript_87180/g.164421  ORF Transcript_87180/g.164421 Transcript_87180/m.164421 type:complete len:241 (+) Transcript_87180:968-1690(+)